MTERIMGAANVVTVHGINLGSGSLGEFFGNCSGNGHLLDFDNGYVTLMDSTGVLFVSYLSNPIPSPRFQIETNRF